MATARKLLSLIGKSNNGAAFRGLVTADNLKSRKEPDLKEGQPVEMYFVGKKAGCEVLAHSGRVATVFLYVETVDGFIAFPGPLPYGLKRGATRTEVRRQLGKPECSGKACVDAVFGPQGAWDRFALDQIHIHFEYSNPGLQITFITLMTEDDAP